MLSWPVPWLIRHGGAQIKQVTVMACRGLVRRLCQKCAEYAPMEYKQVKMNQIAAK